MNKPILMYHSISNNKSSLSVSVDKFYKQMKLMNNLGYETINFNQIDTVKGKQFIITFDDGYEDNFLNALPILNRFNFKATCFFVANCFNGHNIWDNNKDDFSKLKIMSEDQVKLWLQNGMMIGSHSFSHKDLIQINKKEKMNEFNLSKKIFKEKLDIDVQVFSYPYGSYDNETISVIKDYYKYAVTTKRSRYKKNTFDKFLLPRVPINKNDNLFKFFLKIKTPYEDLKYKK